MAPDSLIKHVDIAAFSNYCGVKYVCDYQYTYYWEQLYLYVHTLTKAHFY